MKTACLFVLLLLFFNSAKAQNSAAHLATGSQYYRCGNISVTGNQLTVEALVKLDGTGPYVTGQQNGDIVSKHNDINDVNYLLRPEECEITTTNGYFATPFVFADFSKDSFYHLAMVYDGATLKFYVNGCVYAQTPASGSLITNSYITTIGQLASNPNAVTKEGLFGYADEVRIWSVARTQSEIQNNMKDLPNPAVQIGLLAYYKFEGNSDNIQGNASYNAIPFGSPTLEVQNGFDAVKVFKASYIVQNPTCNNDGSITVLAEGGKAPLQYAINGGPYQTSNTFSNLAAGTYAVSVKSDGIGCTRDTTIILTRNCSANSCDNWLKLPGQPSYVRIGDLDISGNQLTVEANFMRTTPWTGSDLFQGDLVSKHEALNDCNYLLRPGSAEITTTNGYFKTSTICPIELNKAYHAAMVYDGTTLKFYRNGFLMSQVAATGNLTQNNWQTQIGLYFNQLTQENFIGYINEVRIWNIARTQSQIQAYMNQSLPSPQTTSGLLAYYTFDNLINKQGNPAWDGTLGGSATINQTNPNCSFIADSCGIQQVNVVPSFTIPDTVCVGNPVTITNTSTNASSYYWNFCAPDVNTTPLAVNIGNPGSFLSQPVFMDLAEENGNYYGFVVNHFPGGLTRLDFGNSLLNTPTAVFLGNPGNALNPGYGSEGIQIVKANGKWYGIVVGGNPTSPGSVVRMVIISFGTNISNPAPTAVDYGNIGNMLQSIDLHVFQEGGNWYGFTVNAENNTITRFDFTSSFDNPPTAVNLGNIGNFSYPTGVFAVNDNGFWRVFVTNANSASLTRLDFGNSLLNTPVGVNLGNPGNVLDLPRDITIIKYCGQDVGFVVNSSNQLVRLNFSTLTNIPSGTVLGNLGNFNFPHSLSKLFRAGNDIYSFATNVNNNTITRLKFTGCTSSSIPSSTQQNPSPIVYNTPGIYTINLTVDDGLPTQAATCKQVVVVAPPLHQPTQNIAICGGTSIKIGSATYPASYLWNTGATTDSIIVNIPGTYWVETSRNGCSTRDSFIVSFTSGPPMDFGFQQSMCSPKTIQFSTNLSGVQSFQWDFGNNQTDNGQNPSVTYATYGSYIVKLTVQYPNGCTDSLKKTITVDNTYDNAIILNNDTTICVGDSVQLRTASTITDFCWSSSIGVTSSVLNAFVKPTETTTYTLTSQTIGNNLIINGNFDAGNTGFTSQYTHNASSGFNEGVYNVAPNITAWHPGMSNCADHTTGNGNMMMINGSTQTNVEVWSQTIAVQPNTNYTFSTWLQTITTINPAQLQFSINGVLLGGVFNANAQSCIWNQFNANWNSGSNSSAVISIVNMNQVFSGNDFALDDIFFGEITTKTDSFAVKVTGLCDSVKITGPDKICSSADTVTYSVYKSPNCTQEYALLVDNTFAAIISQTSASLKLKFLRDGATTVKVAYANNCKIVVDSIKIMVKFSPASINLGPDIITCKDSLFTLNAGNGFTSYVWQNGTMDSTLLVNTQGTYYIVAQNLCGAQLTDTLNFMKTPVVPFEVQPLSAAICKGDSLQFTATGGTNYSWSPAALFNNPFSSSPKASVNSSQNIMVSITDLLCVRDTVITIPVVVASGAQITISKSNDVNCGMDTAVLVASGGVSYTWLPNQSIVRNYGSRITVRPFRNTTYFVQGTDAMGCAGKDSVTVNFFRKGDQKLFVPSAFTPNGDGLNDVFRPIFIGPPAKYDFRIYNRWGQLVFQSKTPGEGWDGRFKGMLQESDVFVFYITAEGGCNGKFEQKGTIALIR